MNIPFTKMHGLGNDFVVLDRITYPNIIINQRIAEALGDRHFGVGCNQILIIEKSDTADFRYRIYNQDGSEVEMCGNGARCFFKYITLQGLTTKNEVRVEIAKGEIILRGDGENITVDMGPPILEDSIIPVVPNIRKVQSRDRIFEFTPVSMGNPHAVIFIDESITDFPVGTYGPPIETATDIFPKKVNVEFVHVQSPTHIDMRVWERGAGETLACGTGACASVVAGIETGKLEKNIPIRVSLKGGDLFVSWSGEKDASVMMSGPATRVFEGVYSIDIVD